MPSIAKWYVGFAAVAVTCFLGLVCAVPAMAQTADFQDSITGFQWKTTIAADTSAEADIEDLNGGIRIGGADHDNALAVSSASSIFIVLTGLRSGEPWLGASLDWLVQAMLASGLLVLVAVNLTIAAGAVVQTSTGMGFALIVVPLIGLIDMAYLPGPFLFANLFLCLSIAIRESRSLVAREFTPIAGGMIVGSSLGALLLSQIPAEKLGVMFGVFILGAVSLAALSPKVPLMTRNVLIGAVGSGFTGTAAAMHGPPLAMVYQYEKPEKTRATLASAYVYGIMLAFTTLHFTGKFGIEEMRMGVNLLPGVAIGYGIGRLIVGRIPPRIARMAMLTISALGGAVLLIRSM